MPIYEYRCAACGHQLEALQKMSDDPLCQCPSCSGDELKKQISAVGFRLSGSGWYETDFKSKGQRNISGEKESAPTSSNPTSETSSNPPSETSTTAAKPSSDASKQTTNSPAT
ncbi:MAG: zinc ribbon domain-containing protein [Porticoccaceae bacterium]|nr:zinc ribbon domain-containing protein [Porticoccaceae bacterium]